MAILCSKNSETSFELFPYQIREDSQSAVWLLTHLMLTAGSQKVLDTVFSLEYGDVLYMILGLQDVLSGKEVRYKKETMDGDCTLALYPHNVYPDTWVWECWYGLPVEIVRGFRFSVLREGLQVFVEGLKSDLKRLGKEEDPSILSRNIRLHHISPSGGTQLRKVPVRDVIGMDVMCHLIGLERENISISMAAYIRYNEHLGSTSVVCLLYIMNCTEEPLLIEPQQLTLHLADQKQQVKGMEYDTLIEPTMPPLWKTFLQPGHRVDGRVIFPGIRRLPHPGEILQLQIWLNGVKSKKLFEYHIPFHME